MALLHGRMLLLLQLSLAAVLLAAAQAPSPDCNEKCGDVSIPYPFGLTDDCYLRVPGQNSQPFKIACNTTASEPFLQFSDSDNFPTKIANIFLNKGALHIMMNSSYNCDLNNTYNPDMDKVIGLKLPHSYTLSDTNKVYILGCNKATMFLGEPLKLGTSGLSLCADEMGEKFPDICNGFGCSFKYIPTDLQNIMVGVWGVDFNLGTSAKNWSLRYSCGYGFVVDERNFTFAGDQSFEDLKGPRRQLPVLVNWAIGNVNCEAAKNKTAAFACKGVNTECADRTVGYFCRCKDGYEGNPYILDDCQDINECKSLNPCSDHATCKNTIGDHKCECDEGFRNDDHDKNKCVAITDTPGKDNKPMKISLAVCFSFLVVVSITFWIYHVVKKKKFKNITAMYVDRNGGSLLQQELKKNTGFKKPRIFKLEELKKATNNFAENQRIGKGDYGSVYKGTLADNKQVVAIKKSESDAPTVISQSQKQFVNEVLVLSGVEHKNFVTLIGCCLENRTPMLVYEFVGNGKLHEHIHKSNGKGPLPPLPFRQRMKIAAETAKALAHLHHHESTQSQYRDVSCRLSHPKTTNILLDENFTAKVSHFGASKLVPNDQSILQGPAGKGTHVYLDPEYSESHKLTEKSDVYSYGVVLVELLTSRPAAIFNKTEAEKNLAKLFLTSMEDEHLDQILDHEVIKEEESFEIAEQVAQLAKRCLSLKGADRPTMSEVEMELGAIFAKLLGGKPDSSPKETDYLLAASPSNAYVVNVRT